MVAVFKAGKFTWQTPLVTGLFEWLGFSAIGRVRGGRGKDASPSAALARQIQAITCLGVSFTSAKAACVFGRAAGSINRTTSQLIPANAHQRAYE